MISVVITAENLKHLTVPQYEGLYIKHILEKIGMKDNFRLYMPVIKEILRLPKQFIINVAYSIIGDPFKVWIMEMVTERNQKVTKEKDMLIAMDPAVFHAYQNSTAISRKYHSHSHSHEFTTDYLFVHLQSTMVLV